MTSQLRHFIIGAVMALAASAAAFAAFTRPGPVSSAVFEVRAIDPQGHPVAGAEVWLESKPGHYQQVGVTDSFGIWRRNLKLPEGSEVRFNFRKKFASRPARELKATRTFQIGKAGQKRAESHKGSVKLDATRL